jgi:hypothetical protein
LCQFWQYNEIEGCYMDDPMSGTDHLVPYPLIDNGQMLIKDTPRARNTRAGEFIQHFCREDGTESYPMPTDPPSYFAQFYVTTTSTATTTTTGISVRAGSFSITCINAASLEGTSLETTVATACQEMLATHSGSSQANVEVDMTAGPVVHYTIREPYVAVDPLQEPLGPTFSTELVSSLNNIQGFSNIVEPDCHMEVQAGPAVPTTTTTAPPTTAELGSRGVDVSGSADGVTVAAGGPQPAASLGSSEARSGRIQWSLHPTMCLDVSGGLTTNANNIQTYECQTTETGDSNRNFIVPQGTGQIQWATHPDKCIDVSAGVQSNGNNIQLWDCAANTEHDNMAFIAPAPGTSGQIKWAAHPDKCLEVQGGNENALNSKNIVLHDCENEDANQLFTPAPNQLPAWHSQPSVTTAPPTAQLGESAMREAPEYVLENAEGMQQTTGENSWLKWVILGVAAAVVAVGLIGVWAWVLSTDGKDTARGLYHHDTDYSPHQGTVHGGPPPGHGNGAPYMQQPGYSPLQPGYGGPMQQPLYGGAPAPTMNAMGMGGNPYGMGNMGNRLM